jgi:hypothetical protein
MLTVVNKKIPIVESYTSASDLKKDICVNYLFTRIVKLIAVEL